MVGRCNVAMDEHAVQRATPLVYCTARVRSDDEVEETSSRVPNVLFGIAQGIGDNVGVMVYIMTIRLVTCNILKRVFFFVQGIALVPGSREISHCFYLSGINTSNQHFTN